MRMLQTRLLGMMLALLPAQAWGQAPPPPAAQKEKLLAFEKSLLSEHPASYFAYANALWYSGARDQAVFWFYAGTLRFRFRLMATEPTDPSGEPALYSSLRATLGEPINLYAGADLTKWTRQVDAVLSWDQATENPFTDKKANAKAWAEARKTLTDLKDYIQANREQMIESRRQNGIGEIGLIEGVYYDERREKMPKDWPQLIPDTTLARLAGCYGNDSSSLLDSILFSDDRFKVNRATTFEISSTAPGELLAVAKREAQEILRKAIAVRQEHGAVVFEVSLAPKDCGLVEGGETQTFSLRQNVEGDLIIQRDYRTAGKQAKGGTIKHAFTYWNRAKRCSPPPAPVKQVP